MFDMSQLEAGFARVLLFMSDGTQTVEPIMTEADYDSFSSDAKAKKIIPFTYSFGDGMDCDAQGVVQRLACDSNGVYSHVPDNGDLGGIMSNYYTYFVAAGYTEEPNWVTYKDWITGTTLFSACV